MMYCFYLVVDPSSGEMVKAFLAKMPAMAFAGDKYNVLEITVPDIFSLQ